MAYEQLSYIFIFFSISSLPSGFRKIQATRPTTTCRKNPHQSRLFPCLPSVAYLSLVSRSSNPKNGFILGPPHEYQTKNTIRSQQYAYSVDNYNAVLLSKQRTDLDRGQSRSHYVVAWSNDWSRMSGEEKDKQGIGVRKFFETLRLT